MRRAIPLLLAMAVTVNGQCPFAALTINLGSTMVSGGTYVNREHTSTVADTFQQQEHSGGNGDHRAEDHGHARN